MATVHILLAEHFSVPGLIVGAHATREGAVREAVECVNLMLADSPVKKTHQKATTENWQTVMEALQDYHGAQFCYADIIEKAVHP